MMYGDGIAWNSYNAAFSRKLKSHVALDKDITVGGIRSVNPQFLLDIIAILTFLLSDQVVHHANNQQP